MNYNTMKKTELIERIQQLESNASQASTTLQVTACQIFPFYDSGSTGTIKAMASIVINDAIQIRGLRITDGENGLFVGYPIDPFYKGDQHRSVCYPITRALREHIESAVLEHYHRTIGEEASHG